MKQQRCIGLAIDEADMSEFNIQAIRQAASRLQGRVVRTPLLESPMLSERAGCRLFVKAEALQLTGEKLDLAYQVVHNHAEAADDSDSGA